MATDLQLRIVVEASRGAVIAVHASAGLARGHSQALRLLRGAEGLCRSAVAVLQSPATGGPDLRPAAGAEVGARRHRQRGKRQKPSVCAAAPVLEKKGNDQRSDMDKMLVDEAADGSLAPGDSAALPPELPAPVQEAVKVLVPMTQEEVVHAEESRQQPRVQHQQVEQKDVERRRRHVREVMQQHERDRAEDLALTEEIEAKRRSLRQRSEGVSSQELRRVPLDAAATKSQEKAA